VPATLLLLLLAAGVWQSVRALVLLLRHRVPLSVLWHGVTTLLEAGLAICSVLAVLALLCQLRAARRGTSLAGWWAVRAALYLLVLGAVMQLAWLQPFHELEVQLLGGMLAGLYAALVLGGEALASRVPRRPRSLLDLALFNLCVVALCGEVGLRAWGQHSTSPLFAPAAADAAAMVALWRLQPGGGGPGFPVNSRGFMDEEFVPGSAGVPVVATIGDSFSASIVPHYFHFTTVAERALPGVRVHNVGTSAIGPREYEYLLHDDVLALAPRLVVVDLFLGNDLTAPLGDSEEAEPLLRSWLDREQVLLLRVPRLLAGSDPAPRPAAPGVAIGGLDEAGLVRLYPWLADPLLEVESMKAPQYLRLEAHRALGACGPVPPAWPALFATLRRMQASCAQQGAAFAVLLIPDEFQVEDALWQQVVAALPNEHLDRDLPQRVLTGFCAEQGLPCLDLLPRLRAVAPLPDGQRHLYALHDTHWNRRGNAEAGAALAEFVAPLLAADPAR
jgi:hypothetical protein